MSQKTRRSTKYSNDYFPTETKNDILKECFLFNQEGKVFECSCCPENPCKCDTIQNAFRHIQSILFDCLKLDHL